ncbi:hypothetical protein GCM10023346_28210 [Arthrobacter gyeryongensis]|uniref:Uncharacterized protein n=1 Tax=Arthrobacter gyeryongensis TaxID=1650592 RepID=A0ABP9SH27_9MICC
MNPGFRAGAEHRRLCHRVDRRLAHGDDHGPFCPSPDGVQNRHSLRVDELEIIDYKDTLTWPRESACQGVSNTENSQLANSNIQAQAMYSTKWYSAM